SPMGRRLAASIQHALVRRLGLPDCGLHPRSIPILPETRMPAARARPPGPRPGLPECGLHPRSIAILRETRMPAARVEPAVALDELDASRIAKMAFAGDGGRAIADGVTAFSRPAPADIARST